VRLDGRRSQTAGGGRPAHSWRILSKPRGSHAELHRAGTARPLLTPDRRGRYVIGLTVTSRKKRATASRTAASSADRVTVTAGPASLLVPFKGWAVSGNRTGIQVGDTFYPNPSPNASSMQWLTLNRATLTPTKTGNSWFDGTASDDHGLQALTSALCVRDHRGPNCSAGLDQLMILSFPYAGGPGPPVQKDQIDGFNQALKTIGVGPIDAAVLQDHNKLVIVGVPFAGDGSGWYTHGGGVVDALAGWLMPDVRLASSKAFQYRVQPERPAFDTSSSSTPSTNTMSIRRDQPAASLPAGVTGGFQVVEINPIDFTVVKSDAYGSNGSWDGLGAMVTRLNEISAAGDLVAVQSIGHPSPSSPTWPQVASALAQFGANPHIFNTIDGPERGHYAFLGGSHLEKSEVAESSSAVVLDPSADPQTREPGTLRGRMSMRGDGYFVPVAEDTSKSFQSSLHDIVFRPPTPWPYTTGGVFSQQGNCPAPGNNTAAYAAALSFIATGIGLTTYKSDLRQAYVDLIPQDTWSDEKVDLSNLQFESGHDFGQAEFCNLKAELQQEFDWLDNIKALFADYQEALNRSGAAQSADLQSIGQAVLRAAALPDQPGASILWSVGGFIGNMGSAGILAGSPEAWEALVAVYELVRELVSDGQGAPVGDKKRSKVEELALDVSNRLFDTANGLDRLRQVIVSDYGRLSTLGPVARGPGWKMDTGDTATRLKSAANAFFSTELLPLAADVYYLRKAYLDKPGVVTADNCWIFGYGWPFSGNTTQLPFRGDFDVADKQESSHLWVLASPRDDTGRSRYPEEIRLPPADVTDPMFRPVSQKGYGVELARFMWSAYDAPPTKLGYCDALQPRNDRIGTATPAARPGGPTRARPARDPPRAG
jgi:hypothetical protein